MDITNVCQGSEAVDMLAGATADATNGLAGEENGLVVGDGEAAWTGRTWPRWRRASTAARPPPAERLGMAKNARLELRVYQFPRAVRQEPPRRGEQLGPRRRVEHGGQSARCAAATLGMAGAERLAPALSNVQGTVAWPISTGEGLTGGALAVGKSGRESGCGEAAENSGNVRSTRLAATHSREASKSEAMMPSDHFPIYDPKRRKGPIRREHNRPEMPESKISYGGGGDAREIWQKIFWWAWRDFVATGGCRSACTWGGPHVHAGLRDKRRGAGLSLARTFTANPIKKARRNRRACRCVAPSHILRPMRIGRKCRRGGWLNASAVGTGKLPGVR